MKATASTKRISAGSLLSLWDGFSVLRNEKKGPATYTLVYLSLFASIYSNWVVYPLDGLTADEILYPLKPKNPV